SSSSEVPTAMPSLLSSSANSSRRAAKPGGPASGRPPYSAGLPGLLAPDEAILELHPHALGHHVEVGAVLHDDAHRALENGLVDLVDQQDDRLSRCDRLQERSREQELLAEDVVVHVLPAGVLTLGLDAQELLAVVPLVEGLCLVEPLVALEADQPAAGGP